MGKDATEKSSHLYMLIDHKHSWNEYMEGAFQVSSDSNFRYKTPYKAP